MSETKNYDSIIKIMKMIIIVIASLGVLVLLSLRAFTTFGSLDSIHYSNATILFTIPIFFFVFLLFATMSFKSVLIKDDELLGKKLLKVMTFNYKFLKSSHK